MTPLRIFFEALPVVLSLFALVGLLHVYKAKRRMSERIEICAAVTSCFLFLVAQTNWIQSVTAGLDTNAPLIDWVWLAFNTVVMISYLAYVWSQMPRNNKE